MSTNRYDRSSNLKMKEPTRVNAYTLKKLKWRDVQFYSRRLYLFFQYKLRGIFDVNLNFDISLVW